MAKFPIKYTERLPSGRGPSVAMDIDVSTGAEHIGRAVTDLGGTISAIAENVYNRESAVEFSELKRKIDEAGYAAYNAAQGNMKYDPETGEFSGGDAELFTKFQEDIKSFRSEKPRVNALLDKHINNVLPNWRQSFYKHSLGIAAKNANDKYEAEGALHLSKGNLVEYKTLLDARLATKSISQGKYDALINSMAADTLLQQAGSLIASDSAIDQQRAVKILQNFPNVQDVDGNKIHITPDKMQYRNRLLKQAVQTSEDKSDDAITSVVIQKNNLANASPLEKANAAEQLKQELVDGGVVGDDLNKWFGILDKWSGSGKDPTEEYDPKMYAAVLAAVTLEPRTIKESQLFALVSLGKKGGITAAQALNLSKIRRANIDKVGSMQNEIHSRYQGILKGMYNAGMFGDTDTKGALLAYTEAANKLTVWKNINKDATPSQVEDFFEQITAETKKTGWLQYALTGWHRATYFGAPGYLRHIKRELEKITTARKAKQIAQGEPMVRAVGDTEVIGDKTWQIVEKGETPDKDIWELVE